MSQNRLQPVGEDDEAVSRHSNPSAGRQSRQSIAASLSTTTPSRAPSAAISHTSLQKSQRQSDRNLSKSAISTEISTSWSDVHESISSLLLEGRRGTRFFNSFVSDDEDTGPDPSTKNLFKPRAVCPSTKKFFSLEDVEYGLSDAVGPKRWNGNRMSPATRQENEELAQLLAELDQERVGKARWDKEELRAGKKVITEEETIAFLQEKTRNAVFEKKLGEILRLIETRNDEKTENAMESERTVKKHVQAVVVVEAIVREEVDLRSDRKPIRVIREQLCKRIDKLRTNEAEWNVFKQRIGNLFYLIWQRMRILSQRRS
jgi:hypothetical protein